MLVIDKNDIDNTLTLINISKVNGKPNCLTYKYNVLIKDFNPPLPLLSFAKLNDNYIIEIFDDLDKYLYKTGLGLKQSELTNVLNRYNQFKSNNNIELIYFTKDEFLETN